MAKAPAFQFFTGDWSKDPALRSCSLASRGLWIDILCLMWDSPRRGFLQNANGKPFSTQQLARMVGCSEDEASQCLRELQDAGVYSLTTTQVIYSRRMERDEKKRQQAVIDGKRGGNPNLVAKGGDNPPVNREHKGEGGSSSSSSTSVEKKKKEDDAGACEIAWARDAGWSGISDADRKAWASAYPACNIDRQLAAMGEWLVSNPEKARKSRWRRFITNWLSRSQEKGGDMNGGGNGRQGSAGAYRGLAGRSRGPNPNGTAHDGGTAAGEVGESLGFG